MADWVHCNLCFYQPGGKGRKFSLTNCGHIYCDDCLVQGTKEKCKMCDQPCTTITLSSKMKPDVEVFFTDPCELAKKHMKQLVQVMDFQRSHGQRLAAHHRKKIAQQTNVLEKSQHVVEQAKDIEREIVVLKKENAYLKMFLNSMGTSGPNRQTHQPGTAMKHSPAGPARITVRTPPTQGHIGVIPGRITSPNSVRSNTGHMPTINSPMSMSPQHARTGTPGMLSRVMSGQQTPPSSVSGPMSMFATPDCSSITSPGAGGVPHNKPPSSLLMDLKQKIQLHLPSRASMSSGIPSQ